MSAPIANLFDLPNIQPIRRAKMPDDNRFREDFVRSRTPVVLEALGDRMPRIRRWSFEYFAEALKTIRVQTKSEDGAFHYLAFNRISFPEFESSLMTTQNLYALEPLVGRGATTSSDDRRHQFDASEVPGFIPKNKLRVSNLYIGPGENRSLLHYDEVHSLLIMVEGRKKFVLFGPRETARMYGYGVFNVKSIAEGRVIDSRVDPANLSFERFPRVRDARGVFGEIGPGEALFIPAGTWHYIESHDRNVAVNYFWDDTSLVDSLRRPLLEFWVKRPQLFCIEMARRLVRVGVGTARTIVPALRR